MHAFDSSRYLQSKWMYDLSHALMIKVHYMSKWSNPLYWKVTSIQKWLKPIFIILYSIMAGSKIIAGSQPKELHLLL